MTPGKRSGEAVFEFSDYVAHAGNDRIEGVPKLEPSHRITAFIEAYREVKAELPVHLFLGLNRAGEVDEQQWCLVFGNQARSEGLNIDFDARRELLSESGEGEADRKPPDDVGNPTLVLVVDRGEVQSG